MTSGSEGPDPDGNHEVVLVWGAAGERDEEPLRVAPAESILEAAEAAGIALPFGCRRGTCATCTGRLLAGAVHHRRPPRGLKERHLEAGYVLLCIAEPRADCRVRVGSDVHTGLVETPWK